MKLTTIESTFSWSWQWKREKQYKKFSQTQIIIIQRIRKYGNAREKRWETYKIYTFILQALFSYSCHTHFSSAFYSSSFFLPRVPFLLFIPHGKPFSLTFFLYSFFFLLFPLFLFVTLIIILSLIFLHNSLIVSCNSVPLFFFFNPILSFYLLPVSYFSCLSYILNFSLGSLTYILLVPPFLSPAPSPFSFSYYPPHLRFLNSSFPFIILSFTARPSILSPPSPASLSPSQGLFSPYLPLPFPHLLLVISSV